VIAVAAASPANRDAFFIVVAEASNGCIPGKGDLPLALPPVLPPMKPSAKALLTPR